MLNKFQKDSSVRISELKDSFSSDSRFELVTKSDLFILFLLSIYLYFLITKLRKTTA